MCSKSRLYQGKERVSFWQISESFITVVFIKTHLRGIRNNQILVPSPCENSSHRIVQTSLFFRCYCPYKPRGFCPFCSFPPIFSSSWGLSISLLLVYPPFVRPPIAVPTGESPLFRALPRGSPRGARRPGAHQIWFYEERYRRKMPLDMAEDKK